MLAPGTVGRAGARAIQDVLPVGEVGAEALRAMAARAVENGRSATAVGTTVSGIPALARIPGDAFGFAVTTVGGAEIGVGDHATPFSLQSITKLFALAALLRIEPSAWVHVGWAPSELGYGSVAELERAGGRPRNPFVNAGALIVTDRLLHHTGSSVGTVESLVRSLSDDDQVASDPVVAASEAETDHRNRALAHVLAEHGRLLNDVDDVLEEYYAQCAIAGSARAVARAARFLADHRLHDGLLHSDDVRRLNAVLLTTGMYGAAGDIAYRVGLPAKSGVGGGIVAALPGVGTVCAWSPPLDAMGNSVGALAALEYFATTSGWSVFSSGRPVGGRL